MALIQSLLKRLYADWELNERRSIPQLRAQAKHIETYFGKLDASKLKQDQIREYQLKRKQDGMAPASINRELGVLRRAYNLALEAEEIDRVPVFRFLPENNVRQGTYSREEVDRLMAELPEHYRPVVRYAYLTGRRKGEITQLRWDDVDLKRRVITVRQATNKTQEPDTIPLEGELYTLLLDLWEVRRDNCPWVFHRKGQPLGNFWETFTRAAKKAGLEGKLFHDFRRTMATDAIEAGVDRSVAMRITGHKSEAMFRRYNIVPTRSVRNAMVTLTEFRQGREDEAKS